MVHTHPFIFLAPGPEGVTDQRDSHRIELRLEVVSDRQGTLGLGFCLPGTGPREKKIPERDLKVRGGLDTQTLLVM